MSSEVDEARIKAAIEEAAEEIGLATHYRPLIRSLVRNPEGHWPRCCGGGCEPCSATLCAVAAKALEILGTPRKAPLPD